MSNYIIKTNKVGEGMYTHDLINRYGGSLRDEVVLENGMTVKETLFYYSIGTVPFMRQLKVDSLETKMEIKE